jgi:hypothetical protein
VQVFYNDIPHDVMLADLQLNWLFYVSTAVILGGVVGCLIAYPGNLGQLVDYMNTEKTNSVT